MSDNDAINKALAVARTLTYNESPQAEAKHMLHELAHRLGKHVVSVHKKRDGLLMVTAFGQSRFMTWRERAAHRMFGIVPHIDAQRLGREKENGNG